MNAEQWKRLRTRDNWLMFWIALAYLVFMIWGTHENDYLISSGFYDRLLHTLQQYR